MTARIFLQNPYLEIRSLGALTRVIRNMIPNTGLVGSVSFYFASSEVLRAVILNITVIQDVKPRSLVDHYEWYAVTLVTIYQIT